MPRKKPSSPAKTMQQALPLANMEAMVTRPISTLAVQTAAASVRTAAAQRVKQTDQHLALQNVDQTNFPMPPKAPRRLQCALRQQKLCRPTLRQRSSINRCL
ncbi:hypothetical protein M433DRAFT_171810 [Acidomyces richmondensis BFW]|nr:MAG: hypothetical protein FE78DRAFT_105666 [Acidomyces sp. 'richmondensis']KYG48835.1 hypothetical protein M433DRAFT_171810 [Acidomyces richmondensis BFW]